MRLAFGGRFSGGSLHPVQQMSLASACQQLLPISAICSAETEAALTLLSEEADDEIAQLAANAIAAGVAQLGLLLRPLQLEAIALEQAAAATPAACPVTLPYVNPRS